MAFYRQVGEVPPKRHTQFRRPDGGLYSEELDGRGGLLVGLLAALPPRHPVGDRRRPPVGAARPVPDAERAAASRGT